MADISYLLFQGNLDDDYDNDNDGPSSQDFIMDMFHQHIEQSQSHASSNANEDSAWEEVDGPIQDDPDHVSEHEQPDSLEWEVLLNNNPNLEFNPDLSDYNYTEYEILFEQFADNDSSSLGRPPASKTVVENLLMVVITDEDVENNDALCAVCKDEIDVSTMAKQLPCAHRYHGDCIVPWLGIRNTCPVCRYELLTDDVDYERKKAERAASDE